MLFIQGGIVLFACLLFFKFVPNVFIFIVWIWSLDKTIHLFLIILGKYKSDVHNWYEIGSLW